MLIISLSLLLGLPLGHNPVPSGMDAAQFERIIKATLDPIRDVSFIYEGRDRFVGPQTAKRRPTDLDWDEVFQGSYSHRSDGATWMDVFRKPSGDEPFQHNTYVLKNWRRKVLFRTPDDKIPKKPVEMPGPPGTLSEPFSPEKVFYLWLFQGRTQFDAFDFKDLGWDNVGGQKCLKVEMNTIPIPRDKNTNVRYHRFWIDMERGGHPLRVELCEGDTILWRTEIELRQVDAGPLGRIWFPSHGTYASFPWEEKNWYPTPINQIDYAIVDGSIQFNRDLADDFFTVERTTDGSTGSSGLSLRREYERTPRKPLLRIDPESVKKRLAEGLAKADGQVKALEASAVTAEAESGTRTLQLAFGGVGLALVGGALVWKWKAR